MTEPKHSDALDLEQTSPDKMPRSGSAAGELATDQATDLYVEQERRSRRKRFERIITEADPAH